MGSASVSNSSANTLSKRLLVLQPGTTAFLCLLYPYDRAIGPSVFQAKFYAFVESVQVTAINQSAGAVGYSFFYQNATGVRVLASPTQLTIQNSTMTSPFIMVDYAISASSDAGGYYAFVAQGLCPTLLPFAITNAPVSTISPSDFSPTLFQYATCPPTDGAVGSPYLVGTANIDVSTMIGFGGNVTSTSVTVQ
jgi:hypothetical protein